jgi:hypothetical protein
MDSAPASSLCAELRSKKWYFLSEPPRTAADLLDASNWCWCARTSGQIGPDGHVVDPVECGEGRACWRAAAGAWQSLT